VSAIFGIGIDIEEIARFENLTRQWGLRFERKLYSEEEIRYCNAKIRPPQHFAARYAAKEAFSKAIGTGWTGAFRWTDVEVRNDDAGKPSFLLHNSLAAQFGSMNIHLSLSHSGSYVTAMVIIQSNEL
jgi:holo-[acyl-carrier protein] synthase